MKVNDITITLYADSPKHTKEFTLEQNDWESAPDPICMSLITEKSWQEVADELKQNLEDSYSSDFEEEELDDMLWEEYESLVLKHCKCFYYEDMTDEEYDAYKSAENEEKETEILEAVYARIKAEEKK